MLVAIIKLKYLKRKTKYYRLSIVILKILENSLDILA
jgi:hypothetical protein